MSKRKRQREAAMQAKRIYDQDESVLQALQQLAKERSVDQYRNLITTQKNRDFLENKNG